MRCKTIGELKAIVATLGFDGRWFTDRFYYFVLPGHGLQIRFNQFNQSVFFEGHSHYKATFTETLSKALACYVDTERKHRCKYVDVPPAPKEVTLLDFLSLD